MVSQLDETLFANVQCREEGIYNFTTIAASCLCLWCVLSVGEWVNMDEHYLI